MDEALLQEIADKPVFTMEEHAATGGFGAAVCAYMAAHQLLAPAKVFALPDQFVTHGNRAILLDECGLSPEKMAADIINILETK